MFSRNTALVWICIVLLSGMFLMGQDTWQQPTTCPTGTYSDSNGGTWEIVTQGGSVSGTVTVTGCEGTYTVTGNSDGVDVTMRAENPDAGTCCTIVEFVLYANVDCSVLDGTFSHPPDGNCQPEEGPATLSKIALSQSSGVETFWIQP